MSKLHQTENYAIIIEKTGEAVERTRGKSTALTLLPMLNKIYRVKLQIIKIEFLSEYREVLKKQNETNKRDD